jgi:hypothetical protein
MGKGVSGLTSVARRDGGSQMKGRNAQLRVVARAWCA